MQHAPDGDPFAPIAPFYELDLDGFDDDLALWLGLAARAAARGAPAEALELGCGTGRVAAALAGAGWRVEGVDRSPAMLALARRRTAGLPVRLREGDMRDPAADGRGGPFGLVAIPLGGLQHLSTAEDIAAAFAAMAAALAPGGLAAVDVEAPHPDDWLPGPRPLLEHWTRTLAAGPDAGAAVTKLVAVDGRPAESLRLVTWHFDVQPPGGGALRRTTARFPLRVVTAGEIELAARLAGLRAAEWRGGYDGAPPREGDDRLIAVLEHAADAPAAAGGAR